MRSVQESLKTGKGQKRPRDSNTIQYLEKTLVGLQKMSFSKLSNFFYTGPDIHL
jgi:hypothetical protein